MKQSAKKAMMLLAVLVAMATASAVAADWPTHRGNPQRTGNVDDLPGPKTPAVLWVYKAPEHYVASPVPGEGVIYFSALGAFGTGIFHSMALDARAPDRILWSKGPPYIKQPIVCAPAVARSLIVFGDGMHQTDGAVLSCLDAVSGLPLWQLPVSGKLVHLEGAPTIAAGRVYIGAGEAGILCVDVRNMMLDGKPIGLGDAKTLIEARWEELKAKYEEAKKKDANLAVPPSEDRLPKPLPKVFWQKGQGTWHVDAPVAVVGDRVLAASAYIDADKVGKRVLVCLNAADGNTLWETPLKINPWAGPTVAGGLVLVGCSSIRFDAKSIKDAQGEVVAVDLASGQVRWRKDLPGGVLSPVAVRGDMAVFTCTDGKVRGWSASTGEEKWVYAADAPFFAGPAVAGGVVYAADLKAVLHAVGLADGKRQWTFSLPADPSVQLQGMVFGSPLVQGGLVYLATCNIEGEAADQPSVVVCVADRSAVVMEQSATVITVNRQERSIAVPCKVAPRKLATLKEIYPLEVVATFPSPRGQKAHETIVTFEAKPREIHKALESLGLTPGSPAQGEEVAASGPEVALYLELPGIVGKPRIIPVEKTMVDSRTGKPMPALKWLFTGSSARQPDPSKEVKVYAADLSGTLVSLYPVTDETVFQSNLTMRECALLKLETNKYVLPEVGTPCRLIIQVKADLPPVASAAETPAPQMPAGPLAAAPAPDPSVLPPLPARNFTGPDRPILADDPTAQQSHRSATAASPLFRSQAAPFLRLVIPDPFETSGAIELRRVPPDSDPPFPSSSALPKITLPAKP